MPYLSRIVIGCFFLALCTSCARVEMVSPTVNSQREPNSLQKAVQEFMNALLASDLDALKGLLFSDNITFNADGTINESTGCAFRMISNCPTGAGPAIDIIRAEHFIYYYHIDDENVIISFIEESGRKLFYDDPATFLEENYLTKYFSCWFKKNGNHWLLKESVCATESEGYFEPLPDV